MSEVSDMSLPYREMMPNYFGVYPGYEIDIELLEHDDLLYKGLPPASWQKAFDRTMGALRRRPRIPEAVLAEAEEKRQLLRQRHRALAMADEDSRQGIAEFSESDEVFIRVMDIHEVWEKLYFRPRMKELSPDNYGDMEAYAGWVRHAANSGQEMTFRRQESAASCLGLMALYDVRVSSPYTLGRNILVPDSVTVTVPEGVNPNINLFIASDTMPLVALGEPVVNITSDMARDLAFVHHVLHPDIVAIAESSG